MAQVARFTLPEGLLELRDILAADWPHRTAALRASGVPLNEGDDDPADPPDPTDPADPPADPADPDPHDDPQTFSAEYVRKLRDEAARHRREARDAQSRVKEFEDRDKSDAEKLEERATDAERRASDAELELARTRVALRKGLTEPQARRLLGTTEEELEVDADELLSTFRTEDGDDGQDPLRRPRERLRPGAAPSAKPEETDPAKLAASIPRQFGL